MRSFAIISLSAAFSLAAFSGASAACNCGSTDPLNPCTGNSIAVTVKNTGANGADVPATFSWQFNSGGGDARCGQFANGDYWIAPAAGQSSVTLSSVSGSDSISVDADPLTGKFGLLSGAKAYSGYDATEKLSFPSSFSKVTSLVAAIQRDEADPLVADCGTSAIVGECVDAYDVVTVLTSVPDKCGANMIRPNITGANKEFLTLDSLDLSRVPSKSYLTGTTATGLESMRQRWSHSTEIFSLSFSSDGVSFKSNSEAGRAFRSHIVIDDYGAGAANAFHNDLATLFSSANTIQEKTPVLTAMLAYGLDLYHAKYDQPSPYVTQWASGAGQHLGKFTPVVLLAALEKNNPARLSKVQSVAKDPNNLQPQELAQIHIGPNGPVWGDDSGILRYWNDYDWSGCYDTSPVHVAYDYWQLGKWKSFALPVGQYYTGEMYLSFVNSNYNGNNGDMKFRNVSIDGVPINFATEALVDYAGYTGSGSVIDNGATYSMPVGGVGKQTLRTFTISSSSILRFDFYQEKTGNAHSIGFDDNRNFSDSSKLFMMTGMYSNGLIDLGCNPSVGQKTAADPYGYIDGPANLPGSSYFGIGYAGILNFSAIMLMMPEFYNAVNTTRPIDFVTRARTHGLQTYPDPCVNRDTRESSACNIWGGGTGCNYYYPKAAIAQTWGPKSLMDSSAGCVSVENLPYTQAGRFASMDGLAAPFSSSYASPKLYNNWDTIKSGFAAPSNYRADVNNSGSITSADALLVMRYALGLGMAGTAWQSSAATGDANCDNTTSTADALLILRYSLGLDMGQTSWCAK